MNAERLLPLVEVRGRVSAPNGSREYAWYALDESQRFQQILQFRPVGHL